MAVAIRPLTKMQVGIESAKGTLVAATRVIVGDSKLLERRERYRSSYPRGVRGTVGGAGVLTKQHCEFEVDTELSAEQVLWPLMTGIRGQVSASEANNASTWTFTPQLTTGIITVDSMTVEYLHSDGSTNHYASEAGYGLTESFRIESTPDDIAKLSWKGFTRARQTTTPTSSLVPYTTLEELPGALLGVFLDTSWANLGNTQITGIHRNVSFECMTGLKPSFTADQRADKDYADHNVDSLSGKLSITWEFDATAASRFQDYRDNDIVFVRQQYQGGSVGDSDVKTVQIDGAYRFAGDPSFSYDGDQVMCQFELEAVYDETGTAMLEFVVINGLAAIA